MSERARRRAVAAFVLASILGSCSPTGTRQSSGVGSDPSAHSSPASPSATVSSPPDPVSPFLPGMPPPLDRRDVWAADRPGNLAAVVRDDPYRVYVPNSGDNTVTEIDAKTRRVIRTFPAGREPQHVVPSWDLRTLWVNNDRGNSLTPINPRTGVAGRPVPVADPYNLYFTPDGRYAVVMASALRRIDFRNPQTMRLVHSTPAGCAGVNHADFSADGRFFVVSCEFSGVMLKVDTVTRRVVKRLRLRHGAMPQDVKLSPDGRTFFVADMMSNGVWMLNSSTLRSTGFVRTGRGAHGLYVTRDSRDLLVTNRDEGSVSVLDFGTHRVVKRWRIPGGGSPDMGNLSPDGRVFWVSGRYNSVVYAISTVTGRLLAKIPVGRGPHGLCVWPQPGRYSLGHTGVMR